MTENNCGVLEVLAEQDNVARIPFENTPTIESYHHSMPRLSAGKDMLDDFYFSSFTGFAVAYVAFFAIWALILGICKWKKLGGWLSGSRIINNNNTTKPSEESASEETAVPKKQSPVLRIIVYLTLFGIIISNGVLFFTGLKDLTTATEAGLETLDQAESQMKLSVCLFEQVIGDVELAGNETQTLLDRANNICPKVQNQFCKILSDPESCSDNNNNNGNRNRELLISLPDPCDYFPDTCDTLSDIYDDVQGVIQRLLSGVQKGIEFYQEEDALKTKLQEIRDDVDSKIEDKLIEVKEQLETTEVMVTFSSVLCWMSILICLGLLTAHFLKQAFLMKLFFGLFLLVTVLTLGAAVANAIAAFVVSDLCIDDPDSRAIELLLSRLELKSSVLQDMFRIFLENMASGDCWDQPPTQFLLTSIDFLQTGMDAFEGWSSFFWGSDRVQQAACGADALSMTKIEEFMDTSINQKLDTSSVFLEAGGRLFTCSFWMGLFEKGLHQAACYDGMEALATVSLVQFILVCMGMLVVTFRVALWDLLEV